MGPDSGPLSGKVRPLATLTLETNMQLNACDAEKRTAIHTDLGAIFASLELSRSTWRITSLSPGAGEKMSKYAVRGGDIAGLLARFAEIKDKARRRTGKDFPIIVIRRPAWMVSGFIGFWRERALRATLSIRPRS